MVLVVGGVCQLFGFPACRFIGFPACWEVGELAGCGGFLVYPGVRERKDGERGVRSGGERGVRSGGERERIQGDSSLQ